MGVVNPQWDTFFQQVGMMTLGDRIDSEILMAGKMLQRAAQATSFAGYAALTLSALPRTVLSRLSPLHRIPHFPCSPTFPVTPSRATKDPDVATWHHEASMLR